MNKLLNAPRVLGTLALVTGFLLVAGIGVASASIDIGGTNDTTGPNSENENTWEIDDEFDLEVRNEADVDFDLDIEVATGDTDVESNTTVEDFTTGDIMGEIDVANWLNTGDIELGSMELGDGDFTFVNDTTGPWSSNENKAEIDLSLDIEISNDADVDNDLDLDVETGDNDVKNNTVVGDVETGDILFDISLDNRLNTGAGDLDLSDLGGTSIGGTFRNDTTGPNSENENKLEVDSSLDIDVKNEAKIENDVEIKASTGGNDVGNNTVVGDISTGGVRIDYSSTNVAN